MSRVKPSVFKNMVRVGPEPGILTGAAGNWYATSYSWISVSMWKKLSDFQQPLPQPPENFPAELRVENRPTTRWNEVPYAAEVERKMHLNPGKGVVWLVAAVGADREAEEQLAVTMGSQSLVQWSWSDANIKLPVTQSLVWIANGVRRAYRTIRYGRQINGVVT